jgi:hypothetical protein
LGWRRNRRGIDSRADGVESSTEATGRKTALSAIAAVFFVFYTSLCLKPAVLRAQENGWAAATVHNPRFPLGQGVGTCPLTVRLAWATDTLPGLVEWRMAGAGEHVLGIEPTNCKMRGRAVARETGPLVMLEPGEAKTFAMSLEIFVGMNLDEISS